MANVIDCIFPPDRYEFELALRRAFKFVINKEIKSGNEKERETKLVFFDLDTGQDEISNYFQEELFKGKIDAYHILLTLHNPPLDNDLPKYDRIKLFLDYLEKNQLGRKISYFNCVKNLSDLLKNGNLRKPVYRSYENVQHMFYAAVRATFRPLNSKMKSKEIIRKVKHDNIESENHREIFFRSNQGNEMGSDLNDHKMLRSLAQALQEFFPIHSKNSETSKLKVKNHPLDIAYRNRFVTLCRDMGANIVEDVFNWTNETRGSYGQFKVLIIDDNYEPFENQIKVIGSKTKLKFFRLKNEKSWENLYNSLKKYNEAKIEDTANHFVLFARKNELKGEDIEKICADGDKKYFETLITEINKAQIIPMARGSGLRNGNELSLKQFDFFLVDLQFGEQKIGDRMVRYLKRLLEDHRKRSPLLILSLSDDSMDIQRCLNEGARGYIYKERIFSIPYRLKELYEGKTPLPSAAHSQNFRSLYQLPHPIIDRLKREQITGNKIGHEWIDCLPKADLHVHLGGSMPADLIADLAFNHLLNVVYQNDEAYLEKIVKALSKLDPLNLVKRVDEKKLNEIRDTLTEIDSGLMFYKMPFPNRRICEIAGETKPLEKCLKGFVEEELKKGKSEDEARKILKWDDILCVLLVWLAYKSGYDPSHRWRQDGFYCQLLTELVVPYLFAKENIYKFEKRKILDHRMVEVKKGYLADKYSTDRLDALSNVFRKNLKIRTSENDFINPVYDSKKCKLIEQILDAENKDRSLIGYLRGCEISGAALMRPLENIIIAAFRIGLEASLNRIRYMELRCSPDGFLLPLSKDELTCSLKYFISKDVDNLIFDMDSPETVCEEDFEKYKRGRHYQVLATLLWAYGQEFQQCAMEIAYDFLKRKPPKNASISKENFVAPRIAILISAKRHKDLGKIKDQTQMYQMYKKRFSERTEYAPILGFDLAGAEKGFPPSVFSDVMTPLFEKCINMTIHAGEETDWLYIWQSIYKLHAARIGHGLTLGKNLDLLQLAKERRVCIEMCPKSNMLTNKYSTNFHEDFHANKTNYEQLLENTHNDIRLHGRLREESYEGIRKILFPEKRGKSLPYPLRFYYDFGLPVTICRDNPCVSNASMTEEYMEACRTSGGFSKWDILRIIKMGFKNAFLPKEEIARMLQRVGNEVYDKVLELEKIERPYQPSAG
jgi:adenosine deaminase/CheY-like chemotaxis protein